MIGKGAALVKTLYPNIALWLIRDLNLLVCLEHVEPVQWAFEATGYRI
jgi:hypothetical protein